jgi:benzoate membrane transport protein
VRTSSAIQPVTAGMVGTLTGLFGSVAVLLTGLTAAGATPAQAASGVAAMCIAIGVLSVVVSWRTRMPYCFAWSTPGAALLVAAHGGSFGIAVSGFLVAAALMVVTGLVPALARAVERIPRAISGALLAGVLWPFCIAPVSAALAQPVPTFAIVAVWLVLSRFLPRAAGPVVIIAALAITVLSGEGGAALAPSLAVVAPTPDPVAALSIGIPLYLVTMAGQQLPGFAVLRENDFPTRTRLVLTASGVAGLAIAPLGGLSVNLAAITGAIMVGPDAGERSRRWLSAIASGALYFVVAAVVGVVAGIIGDRAPLLVQAAAGLALLGALVGAVTTAWHDPATRVPAAITFLVVASGVVVAGIGSAFWGLLVGGVALAVLTLGRRAPA